MSNSMIFFIGFYAFVILAIVGLIDAVLDFRRCDHIFQFRQSITDTFLSAKCQLVFPKSPGFYKKFQMIDKEDGQVLILSSYEVISFAKYFSTTHRQ